MTQDTQAPERIWPYEWHRYGKKNRGGGQIEYVRLDLLTAAEARAEAAEAERDADRKLLTECEDWIERADKARLDAIAERDRLAGLLGDALSEIETQISSAETYNPNIDAIIRAALANMEKTDD